MRTPPSDYVIPGNADAIRSGSLMCRIMADAVRRVASSVQGSAGRGGPSPPPCARRRGGEVDRQQAEAGIRRGQAAEREARLAAATQAETQARRPRPIADCRREPPTPLRRGAPEPASADDAPEAPPSCAEPLG